MLRSFKTKQKPKHSFNKANLTIETFKARITRIGTTVRVTVVSQEGVLAIKTDTALDT
jgi:hypothetical protein